jgi:D-arabinose 5-phosphate isomerase GutQ
MVMSYKRDYPNLKILLRRMRKFKMQVLRDYGISESDIVFGSTFSESQDGNKYHAYILPDPGTCATFLIPPFTYVSSIDRGNTQYTDVFNRFRDSFDARDRIYMTRSLNENYAANARKFLNHKEIVDTCKEHGVRIVQVDTLESLQDQARIVQGAKVLILEQGSALLNAKLFAKECHVIVLNSTFGVGPYMEWVYDRIRERNTLTLLNSEEGLASGDFTINPASLRKELAGDRPESTQCDLYATQIRSAAQSIDDAINLFAPRLKNMKVYLAGIGKSGLVARKCVATWQSLGLPCHYLNIADMLHGDIGVLQPADVVLYTSNSGNTEELIRCTNYLNAHKPFVAQFLVSNNPTPKVTAVSGSIMIGAHKFVEADAANCAPTVSSAIFMMFLDRLGIRLAEANGFTKEAFKQNHPSGDLGKR